MSWHALRYLTASVLPVRVACSCTCRFCFSRSSVSAERFDQGDLRARDLDAYFDDAWARGARRVVVTGGGEPLLRPEVAVELVRRARRRFDEIALFTNAARLDRALAARLADAGLSYLCWSRHHHDDARNRALMGADAPPLRAVLAATDGLLRVRATAVLCRGWLEDRDDVLAYVRALGRHGVTEMTFKHTYTAWPRSLYRGSPPDAWARAHAVEDDPLVGLGEVEATLPWGPQIRRIGRYRLCFYMEPSPAWELATGIGRSLNLMADGTVYGSLEDTRSRLYRLGCSPPPSAPTPSRTAPSSPSATPLACAPTRPPPRP